MAISKQFSQNVHMPTKIDETTIKISTTQQSKLFQLESTDLFLLINILIEKLLTYYFQKLNVIIHVHQRRYYSC